VAIRYKYRIQEFTDSHGEVTYSPQVKKDAWFSEWKYMHMEITTSFGKEYSSDRIIFLFNLDYARQLIAEDKERRAYKRTITKTIYP
jgi:hypothetical protein